MSKIESNPAPPNPFANELDEDIVADAIEVHSASIVELPEASEEFVSPRAQKPAPDPVVPAEIAAALGVSPGVSAPGETPDTESSGSIFWDDENYFAETLWFGDTGVRLRELSEETLEWFMELADRGEVETDGRVKSPTIALMLSGEVAKATATQQKTLQSITKADGDLLKALIKEAMAKSLCEGVANWVSRSGRSLPAMDDERKLKMGRPMREKCLKRILEISTGFGEAEQDFLAPS